MPVHSPLTIFGRYRSRLRLRSAQLERINRAARQHRAQRKSDIGAVPHLLDQRRERSRQILAAEFRPGKTAHSSRPRRIARKLVSNRRRSAPDHPASARLPDRRCDSAAKAPTAANFAASSSTASATSGVISPKPGSCASSSMSTQLAQHELHVSQRRLIFLHDEPTIGLHVAAVAAADVVQGVRDLARASSARTASISTSKVLPFSITVRRRRSSSCVPPSAALACMEFVEAFELRLLLRIGGARQLDRPRGALRRADCGRY